MYDHPKQLLEFFQYVKWADLRQLQQAKTLPDEVYFKDHGFSYSNVHGLLLHMLSAQDTWNRRFNDEPSRWLGSEASMKARESIEQTWPAVHAALEGFLLRQSPESLKREIAFVNTVGTRYSGEVGHLLLHVLNHSTIHRAQLNSMFKLCGLVPKPVDYSTYYFEVVRQMKR